MDFTLFTVPRSFGGEAGIIQTNAVESWLRLNPRPKILFVSDDPGVDRAAKHFGCKHVPGVRMNERGTPLVSSVFELAQEVARTDLMSYINTDIVLNRTFPRALELVSKTFKQFLMVGRRIDFYYPHPIDFSDPEDRFWRRARKRGVLHGSAGLDYHAFRKGLYKRVPDFYLGRTNWDNWLLWYILRTDIAETVDATETVKVIHIGKTTKDKKPTPERRYNRRLGDQAGTWGRTDFCRWRLADIHSPDTFEGRLFV